MILGGKFTRTSKWQWYKTSLIKVMNTLLSSIIILIQIRNPLYVEKYICLQCFGLTMDASTFKCRTIHWEEIISTAWHRRFEYFFLLGWKGRWDEGGEPSKSLGQDCTGQTLEASCDESRAQHLTARETDDLLQIKEQQTHCSLVFLSPRLSPSANHWCHSCPWNATPLWFSSPSSSIVSPLSLFLSLSLPTPSVPGAHGGSPL